ncbi:MAG: hypothetical protein QS748_10660 [Candidatus Endonucleobacter bathymodioli]|uniref:Uncharacterized protein n=1 Tax=Candidatus Endonucleibacter bathymodioli TaxID=539814 RepID=A0AA90NM25_9GAMM|nr:hypothetical protein [Candidatus Endonucleobacter bathymodioli]
MAALSFDRVVGGPSHEDAEFQHFMEDINVPPILVEHVEAEPSRSIFMHTS